jgi:hypothetical protein
MKDHEEKHDPENPWSLTKNLQITPKSSAIAKLSVQSQNLATLMME